MQRRSLAQMLRHWSLLMLALITTGLAYLLLQLQLSQFDSDWRQRILFEMESLRHTLEREYDPGQRVLPEAHFNRANIDHAIEYLAILNEAADAALLTTNPKENATEFSYRLSAYSLNAGKRKVQVERIQSGFYALYPLTFFDSQAQEEREGWLFAHYDASHDYEDRLRSLLKKVLLIAVVTGLFLLIQHQIISRHIFRPVRRLIGLTESIKEGDYRQELETETTVEIAQLEQAFNELSDHLADTQAKMQQQQALTSAFAAAFPDVGLVLDRNGIISGRFGNRKSPAKRLNEDLIGTPFTAWLNLSAAEIIRNARQRASDQRELVISEFEHDDLYLESRLVPLQEAEDIGPHMIWLVRDISEVKRKQQLIEYQANYDPLTDLANRRMALHQLEQRIHQCRAQNAWSAVLFIDLDHFKTINDSLGHPIGDRLLIDVAHRLRTAVGPGDLIARLGGDEFLVMMGSAESEPECAETLAMQQGQAILDAIRQPFNIDINKFHLTASIGIAVFPSAENGANDLIRQADTAMYSAKHEGRSRISLFNHRMQEETRERLHLFNDLYQAIRDNAFTLVFQPQHDNHGRVTGAEALCRWVNNGKSVYPDVFIAAAEETNLILPLGDWILNRSCQMLREWIRTNRLPEGFKRLAVNISPAQFMAPDFETKLEEAMSNAELAPGSIELELTESLFMGDKQLIREKMQRLSERGYTFALDDFGTGYSSLSYLQKLPINKLKIDRAFVMDIELDGKRASIVDAIIQLGRNLNMEIIAEGVETHDQRDYLADQGCYNYQGYLFSRPLREDSFLNYLAGDTEESDQ